MVRNVMVAVLVGAAVLAATGIYLAVSAHRSAPIVQQRLDFMATVKPDSEFRIFRVRSQDWRPFDRTTALAIFDALATATPRDGKGHAAVYSPWDTQPPPLTVEVAWCKDMKDKSQRDKGSIAICYGNWLFWYGDEIYQLSRESHEVLNRVFPEDK